MFQKNKLPAIILSTLLFANYCLGQIKQRPINFQFLDKYGSIIKVQNLSSSLKPIDSVFLRNKISSQLILQTIDTSTTQYEFLIYNITLLKNNTYKVKIGTHCEYKESPVLADTSKNLITKNIGRRKVKQICGTGISIYKLIIKKIKDEYTIDKFIYLYSEI